jgi:hypothetical protein
MQPGSSQQGWKPYRFLRCDLHQCPVSTMGCNIGLGQGLLSDGCAACAPSTGSSAALDYALGLQSFCNPCHSGFSVLGLSGFFSLGNLPWSLHSGCLLPLLCRPHCFSFWLAGFVCLWTWAPIIGISWHAYEVLQDSKLFYHQHQPFEQFCRQSGVQYDVSIWNNARSCHYCHFVFTPPC